jgi:predicted NBD/HSP70 family sugar kinase
MNELIGRPATNEIESINIVTDELRAHGRLSSSDIARRTGLAKSTVSAAVARLKDEGIVIDAPQGPPRHRVGQGRPATLLSLNPEVGACIGLMMEPNELHAILADVSHNVLASASRVLGLDYSVSDGVQAANDLVGELCAKTSFQRSRIVGVGVAASGPVHPGTSRIGRSNIIPGWRGVHVRDVFESALGLPVVADNESNCSALAEFMWGAARGVRNVVYMKVDIGVGGAVIVGGRLVRGVAGGAGEFGHMTFRTDGPLCRCGKRGCYQMYIATPALLDLLAPQYGADFTAAQMIACAKEGDIGCARVIADAGEIAGQAVALACNTLNPELVVIGGQLAQAGEILFEPLRQSFMRQSLLLHEGDDPDATTVIVPGTKFGADPALGAVGLVLRNLGERARIARSPTSRHPPR